MLNKAGKDTTSAKSNFRIPFAAFINLNIRPILKTLTTLNNVGEIGKSIMISSIRMPNIDARTNRKSKTFHGTVK